MISRIHVQVLARGARAEVRQKIERRFAHVFDGHIAAQGRVIFVPLHDVAEIANAGSGQRLDRSCTDGIHADVVLAQIFGQVFDGRLQGRLGHAHHVIMRHDLFGPVIGEGHGTAAILHHLFGALHDSGERVDRDIHRQAEICTAGVHVAAAQLVLVGKANGVDDEVQVVPMLFQLGEQRVNRCLVAHIAGQDNITAQLGGQRIHPLFQRIPLV
mmetsp:Transcript_22710/g.37482  ORF Transcript_22710/g.37482 Transcript_22710/m.37482 type:complete len:214 (-) Transcript_22710:2302-2943(-)